MVLSLPDAEPIELGPPKSRQPDEPIRVSPDDPVPQRHFYRLLDRPLDLAFARDSVREAYADTGRPSIDPVVFVGLQLILFFERLRPERRLTRAVAARLGPRWYLGYGPTEVLPDRSGLPRLRERYGRCPVASSRRSPNNALPRAWSGGESRTSTRRRWKPMPRSARRNRALRSGPT